MGWNVSCRSLLFLLVDPGTTAREVLIEGRYRDGEAAGNLFDRDARIAEERQPGGLVLLVEPRRSSAGAATGAGGGEPGAGPLLNDGPLELSERAEDVKDELAAGSVGVDALAQRPEVDLAAFGVHDGLDELLHRPR